MTRPIPKSYYFSGQGRVSVADRSLVDGSLSGFRFLGNVTELTINVSNTKQEHKESMTGNRGVDETIIKEIKPTIKFKAESISLSNLALAFYGTSANEAGAAVTAEIHKVGDAGTFVPLAHPAVTLVVVKVGDTADAASTAAVLGTDYNLDADFGVIHPIVGGALAKGKFISVAYTYGTTLRMDALNVAVPPEKMIRFDGLNTVNGDLSLVELYRCKLEPIQTFSLINDDFANMDFTGNLLLDDFRPANSQYWSQRNFALPVAP